MQKRRVSGRNHDECKLGGRKTERGSREEKRKKFVGEVVYKARLALLAWLTGGSSDLKWSLFLHHPRTNLGKSAQLVRNP
jgi:hypothetical protein